MTNLQWIQDMERALAEAKKHDARLQAGVRSAAPKVRKSLKEVSDLCRAGRQDALGRGKAIPKRVMKQKEQGGPKDPEITAAEPVPVKVA